LAAQLEWPAAAEAFARAASRAGTVVVIVTLGDRGAVCQIGDETHYVTAPAVSVVDTTGAGDAFVGALAAALDGGCALPEAPRHACLHDSRSSAFPPRSLGDRGTVTVRYNASRLTLLNSAL